MILINSLLWLTQQFYQLLARIPYARLAIAIYLFYRHLRRKYGRKMFFCCSNRTDYRNNWRNTQSTRLIREFITFCDKGDGSLPPATELFAIQAVTQEDFGPVLSTVWYVREGNGFKVDTTNNSSHSFKRSNDYKNFKCKAHNKYFEVNLYTKSGVSYHHESTRSGRLHSRDASIDLVHGSSCTKGAHWTHPAKR